MFNQQEYILLFWKRFIKERFILCKMAAHLFNESGQMQEVDIPDIFDVLAGGEDESAVKLLLGFSAEDEAAVALMSETGGGGLSITPGSQNLVFLKLGGLN